MSKNVIVFNTSLTEAIKDFSIKLLTNFKEDQLLDTLDSDVFLKYLAEDDNFKSELNTLLENNK